MSTFDLRATDVRILECSNCDQPVVSEQAATQVTLRCGYCNFEDIRELTAARAVDLAAPDGEASPYRRAKGPRRGSMLRANLEEPPPGLRVPNTPAELEQSWRTAKREPAPTTDDPASMADARAAHEYRQLWLATLLVGMRVAERDFLRARATLETILELVTIPAYRGLVLARLARIAALSDAPELGEKWLAAVPLDLRVAEVSSDVKVATACLARARGDFPQVLRIIGERDTADEFAGPSRWLAVLLRIDAHEQCGDRKLAVDLWRASIRGRATTLTALANQSGLAVRTRRRSAATAVVGLAFGAMAIYGLVSVMLRIPGDVSIEGYRFALIGIGLFGMVVSQKI